MVTDIQNKAVAGEADRKLKTATRILFAIGVVGQWLFVYYIVAFYGGILRSGAYERVNEALAQGLMEGDGIGNFVLGVHIALAAVITLGGPLQFIPAVRNRFPVFHRWNGRLFFATAFLGAGAGLYLIYSRGSHGGGVMMMGNTLNAALIMIFSALAWRMAMARDFTAHKKWALRAFLMVSGVWFFRIGYGLWILLTGFTAVGANASLTGPFDRFLAFGHSLVPLLILEFYFFARAHSSPRLKRRAAALFSVLCLFLAAGIVMAGVVFWFPKL